MIKWIDGDRFVLGETTFRASPQNAFAEPKRLQKNEIFIFKPRRLVDRYATLIEELKPQHIFELGIFGGGSTVFFAELARPKKVVAIDLKALPRVRERVNSIAARSGLADAVRTFGEIDQADRSRLAEIVDDEFDSALDLIIDDCSHFYEPTLASFNELFPRLRPGGFYVIEDWRWAHSELGSEHTEGFYPDEVPLTRLLFEIALAIPGAPGIVDEIAISKHVAVIVRGEKSVDSATFDVSGCSNPRGQAVLAPA